MNRILLTGTTLLTLVSAGMPASAAHKHATRYYPAPVRKVGLQDPGQADAEYRTAL